MLFDMRLLLQCVSKHDGVVSVHRPTLLALTQKLFKQVCCKLAPEGCAKLQSKTAGGIITDPIMQQLAGLEPSPDAAP